jgi:hypothetical protein
MALMLAKQALKQAIWRLGRMMARESLRQSRIGAVKFEVRRPASFIP